MCSPTEPPGGARPGASSEAPAQARAQGGAAGPRHRIQSSQHVPLGGPCSSPLLRSAQRCVAPSGRGASGAEGCGVWKGRADPAPYRIVEEIRLVQVPQVQEAGSGEQPVRREGLQDGVHRGGLRGPLGLASLTPGRRRARPRARAGGWRARGGRSGAHPAGGAGGGGAAPGRGRGGRGEPRARGRQGSGAPGAPRAFSRLLFLRLLRGHSWLPWGARERG